MHSSVIYWSKKNSSEILADANITNKTEGLEIALFSEDDHSVPTDAFSFPQQFTSPECGAQGDYCHEITTFAAKEPSRHFSPVPYALQNALLVLDIDTHRIRFRSNFTLSIEKCSPISVLESFYTLKYKTIVSL